MTTTFQSRELVRDELAALFVANGTWQAVYGYRPSVKEVLGKTPVLVIRSRGTQQDMAGLYTNPATYRFSLQSWVLASSETDATVTSAIAEDELDTLDKTLRQVIRTNAGSLANADNIRFEESPSEVVDIVAEGLSYMIETRFILVELHGGSVP
jgi:hypothetical protein